MKTVKFANSVDLDEVAHNEPPHLDLHFLITFFESLRMISLSSAILVVKELSR